MKNILHIMSSPRGKDSVSIKLGNAIVEKLTETYPGSRVTEKNLAADPISHLEGTQIKSFYTPDEGRTQQERDIIKHSDEAIAELKEADIIVIGVPMFNFGIPSSLKSWLDNVIRPGHTFKYGEGGAEGLLKGKKVYVALASGGVYSEGPMKDYDFASPYLEKVLKFIGLDDVTVIRAEGTSIPDIKDMALEKAMESFVV